MSERRWKATSDGPGRALALSGGALLAAAATLLAGVLPAAAATTPPTGSHAATRPTSDHDNPAEPGVCEGCQPPLTYRGGPTLGNGTAGLTLTSIYWVPSGYTYPAAYPALMNQFVKDVAAASGKNTNSFAIDTEYSSVINGVVTPIKYSIKAGTPVVDTTAFAAAGAPGSCSVTPNAGLTACVDDTQIQHELAAVEQAKSLPADLNHMYLVFFPPGVETQQSGIRSAQAYCGIHSAFDTLDAGGHLIGTTVYADEPYVPICGSGQSPNGDPTADGETSILAHEINEAITDPATSAGDGWQDGTGQEIGDECNFYFGPPTGSVSTTSPETTEYNQTINNHKYYLQNQFSNARYASLGIGNGCTGVAYQGTGAATAATAAPGTQPRLLTLDASAPELPADGTSTSTVTITELDGNGEPAVGDHLHLLVRSKQETPGQCGTLSTDTGVTDADGRVSVTYTASTASVACFVLAIDAERGMSDETVIYQGSTSAIAPVVTQSVPSSVSVGGAIATFTATAANPSSTDITDARYTVYFSGDDTATTGLDGSDLQLSYSDANTGGAFVAVPLSGSTVNDGEISAAVLPDSAAVVAAGASDTITFQLTLKKGAVQTGTTGAPLRIETDLDQIDPADNSESNLEYAGPTELAVLPATADTFTYSGKMITTTAPTATAPGAGQLVAAKCTTASGPRCSLTGTAVLTTTGGTLTGFIVVGEQNHDRERTVTFTETFSYSNPTTGAGSGNGLVCYVDTGVSAPVNIAAAFTTAATDLANVVTEQGTITAS